VVYAFGLAVLGGSYAATGSEGAQVLALFALTFGVYPAVTRAFGQSNDFVEAMRELTVPFGAMAMSVAFLELYVYLAERRVNRHGGAGWKPVRPLRDAVLAGLITVPVIAIITSLQGFDADEALLTGLLCGCIVFAIAGAFTWMSRKARDTGRPGVS
jgi:hypothetical protein